MAEVLVEFDTGIPGPDGERYTPRACARRGLEGRWEGWLEFTNVENGAVLRSGRETTQPTRDDTMYWATGLSRVYLEGALVRALTPPRRTVPAVHTEPAYDGPAPTLEAMETGDSPLAPRAILDPFEVYAQGEGVLRQELVALSTDHLRGIIAAFGLGGGAGAQAHTPEVLAEYIVAEVRSRVKASRAANGADLPYGEAEGPAW